MRSVLEDASGCQRLLPKSEQALLYAQLVYPARLICSMTAHARFLMEACFASSEKDSSRYRGSLDKAIAELKALELAIPKYTSGKFRRWYADCRKVNPFALRERTENIIREAP